MARTHHPAATAAALALPVALAVGVITAAVITQHRAEPASGPVVVGGAPAPAAGSPACSNLLPALPERLGGASRAPMAAPAPAGAAAWRTDDGHEALILRCGIERPAEFDQAAALVVVNGVQWLQISGAASGIPNITWVAVDRGVYLALTLPAGGGSAAVQDASNAIRTVLPAQPLDPAPVR